MGGGGGGGFALEAQIHNILVKTPAYRFLARN